MYKKIITGSIVVLTWGISALFAADGEMTAAEMQALWHGHHAIKMVAQDPNAEANLKVAEEAKMRVAATKPKVAIQRLKDVHEKLGTGSSFLACIQEIETLLGPDHRSLAEKLRALLGIVGDQKALLVILEDFRTCLGGVGTLGDRIQIILKIIGTPQHADPDLRNLSGIVIPELYRVLARLGFGESMHATIDRAIQCVGGVEVTVFGNIAGVKKLVGGSGTLVERVQTLYALIPGGGTLLEQVQKMLVSNKQLQVDFDEKKKLLTASMSRVSVLEDDVIELQSKITASAQQVAALEKIITEKEAALKAQEETLDATRKILEEKEAVLKTLEAEKEAWDEDSETYEQHVQQLTAEKAALAQQISEKEAALRKATEEKDALEEKLKVAEESVARLIKEVRTEKARADSFYVDLEERTEALAAAQKDVQRLQGHLEEAESGLAEEQEKVRQLGLGLQALEEENQQLIEAQTTLKALLDAEQVDRKRLEKELSSSESRGEALEEENRHLIDTIEANKKRIVQLEMRVEALEKKKTELVAELEVARIQHKALEARVLEITKEKERLQRLVHEAQEREKDALQQVELLQSEVADLKERTEKAQTQLGMPLASLMAFNDALGGGTVRQGVQALGTLIGVKTDIAPEAETVFNHVLKLLNGGMRVRKNDLRGVDTWASLRQALLKLSKQRTLVLEIQAEIDEPPLSPLFPLLDGQSSDEEGERSDGESGKKKEGKG